MKPQYIVVTGAPKIVLMDTNKDVFNVTIRTAAGQTVDAALEDVFNKDTAPDSPGPTWLTLTASPLGANIYTLALPVRLIRITGVGTATILQQGI